MIAEQLINHTNAREIHEPNLHTPDVPGIVRTTNEPDPVPVGVTSET